jgi:hypothetical protein
MHRLDASRLCSLLLDTQCVNFINVIVDHNNQGDGMSRVMPLTWEYGGGFVWKKGSNPEKELL